ncbi:hypothetical protein H5410_051470 [Solanum commersonii]|uniref:Uncharacterized protein n=1 Tax=Solanum commersonii TaxID=4109 RepID=A0A9J5WYH7_SOLCO|nr:hypothetical protein H5410_051470 [Solanum commersonii]
MQEITNDLFQFKGVKRIWMKSRWILSLLKRKNNLQRALKTRIYFKRIIDRILKGYVNKEDRQRLS